MAYITLYKRGDIAKFNVYNIFYGEGMSVRMMMPHFMCNPSRMTKVEYYVTTNISAN